MFSDSSPIPKTSYKVREFRCVNFALDFAGVDHASTEPTAPPTLWLICESKRALITRMASGLSSEFPARWARDGLSLRWAAACL